MYDILSELTLLNELSDDSKVFLAVYFSEVLHNSRINTAINLAQTESDNHKASFKINNELPIYKLFKSGKLFTPDES